MYNKRSHIVNCEFNPIYNQSNFPNWGKRETERLESYKNVNMNNQTWLLEHLIHIEIQLTQLKRNKIYETSNITEIATRSAWIEIPVEVV